MNDDNWTTLQSAGKVPPPSPEVLAHATRRVERASRGTRRRRILAPVLAATATAAVIGVVALQQSGTPTADPGVLGTASPTPAPSTEAPASKPLGDPKGTIVDCVHQYSPAYLGEREFAFDGTVLAAVPVPRTAGGWKVTFQVHEWFRPSGSEKFTVFLWVAPGVEVERPGTTSYAIGDRLLISGGSMIRGGDAMKNPVAATCGFSRTYDVPTAATWRKAFGK